MDTEFRYGNNYDLIRPSTGDCHRRISYNINNMNNIINSNSPPSNSTQIKFNERGRASSTGNIPQSPILKKNNKIEKNNTKFGTLRNIPTRNI